MKTLLTSVGNLRAQEALQVAVMRPYLFALLPMVLFFANSDHLWAQNTQNTLLPEINPQDIEIRSEFKANFPGLRRQPILGFNPTPRVFQIDPNLHQHFQKKHRWSSN